MSLLGEKMSKINGINENVIQIGKGLEKGIFLYPSLDGLLQGILGKNTPLPYKEINGRYTDNFGGRIAKAINYTIGTAFAFVPWLVSRSIRAAVYDAPRGILSKFAPTDAHREEQVLADLDYAIKETRAALVAIGFIEDKTDGIVDRTNKFAASPDSQYSSDLERWIEYCSSTYEPALATLRMHYTNAREIVIKYQDLIKQRNGQVPIDDIGKRLAEFRRLSDILFLEIDTHRYHI